MPVAEQVKQIAENMERVYDAGYQKSESDFWDVLQNHGTRGNYEYAFNFWDKEYIRPKYKVVPTSRSMSMFQYNVKLKAVEKEYFDFSKCTVNNTNSTGGNYCVFRGCIELQTIEDVGMQPGYYYGTFYNCRKLETIEVMRIAEETLMGSGLFYNCLKLKNITIEGTIGQNGFDISHATKLTKESLISIVSALSEHLTETKTITLPKTAVYQHFSENGETLNSEWTALIANKGKWNFAFS